MRADALGVVQFIHPGQEQVRFDRRGWCPWNPTNAGHHRKFITARAEYVNGSPSREGLVGFWGEWEPPSAVRVLPTPTRPGEPRVCHIPAFYKPADHRGLFDTDPFVFGDRFLYNGCQQHTAHRRPGGALDTFLRWLAPGSMILFGSGIDKQFRLDTVLVVADHRDYPNGVFDDILDLVPDEYVDVTLLPQWKEDLPIDSFRLYRGATAEAPTAEMFSFTPCVPFAGRGFPRPALDLPGIVTPVLTQGKKFTRMATLADVRAVWLEVVRQVGAAGLAMAHRIPIKPWRIDEK